MNWGSCTPFLGLGDLLGWLTELRRAGSFCNKGHRWGEAQGELRLGWGGGVLSAGAAIPTESRCPHPSMWVPAAPQTPHSWDFLVAASQRRDRLFILFPGPSLAGKCEGVGLESPSGSSQQVFLQTGLRPASPRCPQRVASLEPDTRWKFQAPKGPVSGLKTKY